MAQSLNEEMGNIPSGKKPVAKPLLNRFDPKVVPLGLVLDLPAFAGGVFLEAQIWWSHFTRSELTIYTIFIPLQAKGPLTRSRRLGRLEVMTLTQLE